MSFLPMVVQRTPNALATIAGPAAQIATKSVVPAVAVGAVQVLSHLGRLAPIAPTVPANIPTINPAKMILTRAVDDAFPKVTHNLTNWLTNFNRLNSFELYNYDLQGQGLPAGRQTWQGENCCQMTSHLLARELEAKDYNVTLKRNDFRQYPCNHFYLEVSGNGLDKPLIVDSTYRQFFRADVNDPSALAFNRELFAERDPFFVGTRDELKDLTIKFIDICPPRMSPFHYDDSVVFWSERKAVDMTSQLQSMRPKLEEYIKPKVKYVGTSRTGQPDPFDP